MIYSSNFTYGQNQKLTSIVNEMAEINEVQYEYVGMGSYESDNYKNFTKLKHVATVDELVHLTDHHNGTVICNPKEQTTVQKLTNGQTTKKPTRKMAHLVFPDTRANAQKTKRAIFLPTL